jgi:NAD(P)-dependent dehydrogenase (short-subunit alcohol dehydrogenase family)
VSVTEPTEPQAQDDETVRARLLDALSILREAAADRGLLAVLGEEERKELLLAAGHVSRPDRNEIRKLLKALRKRERDAARRADAEVLDATGIRALRRAPVFPTPALPRAPEPPPLLAGGSEVEPLVADDAGEASRSAAPARALNEPRKCYVCKAPFTTVHAFYDQMCGACAELNWERRNATADLRGRVAIVTGSRVKIGYHAAIKLLRAGAKVIVTTRFPRDAALRYAREADFEEWRDRLEVYGLDLRHTPSVEAFAAHVLARYDRLDFLLNNACQTVRRPPGFYRHLMHAEGASDVPEHVRPLLAGHEALRHAEGAALARQGGAGQPVGLLASAALSQVALTDEDRRDELHLFPDGQLDQDLQQVDLRGRNSWRLALHEVPTVELLEVQLVNAVAPFVLDARLKPLMLRVPTRDKHIVNVSAMEGQFYREHKTDKHPHTNMAKAALNMLTRTSAADYVKDGIHMNSVDTGWITDEDPLEIAARKQEEHGFHPPLDVVDGAARIVDPIFDGFRTGKHAWGLFLKDYRAIPW